MGMPFPEGINVSLNGTYLDFGGLEPIAVNGRTLVPFRALLEGLGQTRALIAQAYAGFNAAGDPDLIESYVFEINALQARYSYLLRRVKELEADTQARLG